MSDIDTSADTGPELNTVADAMAELDRREAARKAARKAERAASLAADDAGDAEDADPRKVIKPKTESRADNRVEAKDADDSEDDEDEDKSARRKPKAEKVAKGADSEDDDDEGDDEGDEDADQTDDEQADHDDKPRKIKIKVAGREVETTPEEVSQHIERANHEVATARQEREQFQQARQQVTQQLSQYAQQVQAQGQFWQQVAQRIVGSAPDPSLAHSDPMTFVQQRADYEARVQFLQSIVAQNKQQAQAAAQQAHASEQEAISIARQRGLAVLHQVIPDLADQAKAPALTGRLVKVAHEHGFSPEMLQSVVHPGFIVLLHKAMRADDMDAQRARARDKLAAAPTLSSPEPGASAGQRTNINAKRAAAKKIFLQSGRTMRDAERFLRATS